MKLYRHLKKSIVLITTVSLAAGGGLFLEGCGGNGSRGYFIRQSCIRRERLCEKIFDNLSET